MEVLTHSALLPKIINGMPMGWQVELEQPLINEEPNDRSIEFFIDPVHAPGKHDDVMHVICDTKSICLFNVPRRGMEFLNYPLLAQIKDQTVFSLKYKSKMKILSQNSYVNVFTNESSDMHWMTQDPNPNLNEMDTFIFHQSTYIPSMTYSLLMTMLDTRVLNKIQCQAVQVIFNTLACQVAFGPKDLCGMALLDMSVEQGVQGVQHFTARVFSKDSVSNLIVIALQSLQIKSGSGSHLLENPSVWIPYITSCWLTSI
jgi:hypothetical protein